jgi:hypothetical protein
MKLISLTVKTVVGGKAPVTITHITGSGAFLSCSKMGGNYSKIKQLYCSVFKQLDGWMTTKILF